MIKKKECQQNMTNYDYPALVKKLRDKVGGVKWQKQTRQSYLI